MHVFWKKKNNEKLHKCSYVAKLVLRIDSGLKGRNSTAKSGVAGGRGKED